MKSTSTTFREADGQQGFAIVSAIFLLVVLAGLGALIVTLSGSQHQGQALDVTGSRALIAARAGLDWGVCMMVKQADDDTKYCGSGTGSAGTCSDPMQTFDSGSGSFANELDGYSIRITCTQTPIDEGTTSTLYLIEATACNTTTAADCPSASPGPFYVERKISSLVEQ